MRLVDADAIYNKAEENRRKGEIEDWEFDSIVDYLDGAPTINDAEIVVRCKDCKFRNDRLFCRLRKAPAIVTNTDFCSYGVRE